jgi:hypothetical protein
MLLTQPQAWALSGADGTFRIKALNPSQSTQLQQLIPNIQASAILNELKPNSSKVGFQVFNFETSSYSYKEGLFLVEGEHCKLFAQQLGTGELNAHAATIARTFDEHIYPLVAQWFGTPAIPERLGLPDSKIYIFLTELEGAFSEGYVAGYFDHRDLELDGNRKPLLFMDIARADAEALQNPASAFYKTLAHELQHLANYSQRKSLSLPEQERWLDEAYSMFAEYLYSAEVASDKQPTPPVLHLEKYLQSPSIDLTNNSEAYWFKEPELYQQYGASFVFMVYLVQKYGGATPRLQSLFLNELVLAKSPGARGIDELFAFAELSFNDILLDLNLALFLDDASLNNGLWAFNYKSQCFGELATRIPLTNAKASAGGDCFVLPSTLTTMAMKKALDLNSYVMHMVEIPVFDNLCLGVLKKK